MIEFKNVSFSYEKGKKVLDDISFVIEPGETVGLIGANGAGKSTIMKIFLGLLFPTDGMVSVDGITVDKSHLSEVRQKIGFVLQNSDNQMFMPTVYEDMIFGPLNYGIPKDEVEKKVDAVLAELDLAAIKNRHNHKISGGEKRMAAIATVLCMEPEVILMDEPSTALDPVNRRTVINTINKLPQTKLIASHDLDMILDTCDRVILISNGKVVADGKTLDILKDKELLESNRMELPFCLQGFKE